MEIRFMEKQHYNKPSSTSPVIMRNTAQAVLNAGRVYPAKDGNLLFNLPKSTNDPDIHRIAKLGYDWLNTHGRAGIDTPALPHRKSIKIIHLS